MAHIFASERGQKPQKGAQSASRAIEGANLTGLQNQANASASPQHLVALQRAADPIQRMDEEEPLQGKAKEAGLVGEPVQLKQTGGSGQGLPSELKAGVESLSGMDMSSVQVHYNSARPAQLQANAYAQGNNIHVASGQERHVPHEAWHVVQQKQGRVKPTMQLSGQQINDNAGLEREADTMGAKALRAGSDTIRK